MARDTVTKQKIASIVPICTFCMLSRNKCNVMIESNPASKEQLTRAFICDYCVEDCIRALMQRRSFAFQDFIVQPKQRKQG